MSHIKTMIALTNVQSLLDEAQTMINFARISFAESQELQLELDRKQSELNAKRRKVMKSMDYIANQN